MIKLIKDRVAIVPIENPDMVGSLYIPDIAKDRLNQGFVKYKGPDVRHLKIGAYVLFSGYSGTLTYIEDEGKLIIMPEHFIVAELVKPKSVEIPGLYFRDKFDAVRNNNELKQIAKEVVLDLDDSAAEFLAAGLSRRGVIAPEASPFYTANYELSMSYVAQAFGEDKEWRNSIQVMTEHPEKEEYDLLGGGNG